MAATGYEFDKMSRRPLYLEVTRRLLDLCPCPIGGVIADVGCGSGLATELLLERYNGIGQIVAFDPSEEELAIASNRLRRANVRFFLGRAQDVERLIEPVDGMILSNVIHLIPI